MSESSLLVPVDNATGRVDCGAAALGIRRHTGRRRRMIRIGKEIGGSSAMMLGAFIVWSGDFATPWENVPVTGPLRGVLAYLIGAALIAAGVGVFWPRTDRAARAVLTAISLGFTLLYALVAAKAPLIYDFRGGLAEQVSITAGYLCDLRQPRTTENTRGERLALGARVCFGVCSISFGVVHSCEISRAAPTSCRPGCRLADSSGRSSRVSRTPATAVAILSGSLGSSWRHVRRPSCTSDSAYLAGDSCFRAPDRS